MNILLVNDDGYNAKGIIALEKQLNKYGQVYVVAPKTFMSGKAIALTIHAPIEVIKYDDYHYAIDGTPADCSAFGLSCLNVKFDVVISGINEGLNITYDILHSGTVGACIESLMYDVPCIAFSAEKNLDFAKDYVSFVMDFILKNKLLSNKYCINVNFPINNIVKGIKLAKVVQRKDNRYFSYDGQIAFPKRDIDNHLSYPKDSDVYLVNEGYIAISFLKKDFYSETLFNQFKDSGIF